MALDKAPIVTGTVHKHGISTRITTIKAVLPVELVILETLILASRLVTTRVIMANPMISVETTMATVVVEVAAGATTVATAEAATSKPNITKAITLRITKVLEMDRGTKAKVAIRMELPLVSLVTPPKAMICRRMLPRDQRLCVKVFLILVCNICEQEATKLQLTTTSKAHLLV